MNKRFNPNSSLGSLQFKITSILLVFFVVACTAIGLTLFTSGQLKGVAAAINDAGSLRMGTYRMAWLVSQGRGDHVDVHALAERLDIELTRYERVLEDLVAGDPRRPLHVPRSADTIEDLEAVTEYWRGDVRPRLIAFIRAPAETDLVELLLSFDMDLDVLVAQIDAIVVSMEQSYATQIAWLRGSQFMLVLLAIIGTVFLIRFFAVQVIHPVEELSSGLARMEEEDFGARLAPGGNDELGKVADGFNRMASHLQRLYRAQEQHVREKTESLTASNRELGILYSIIRFLHEPQDMDSLCRGFLARVRETMGASAAAIRLMDKSADRLYITYCEGLEEDFLDAESVISCADCLCGLATEKPATIFSRLTTPNAPNVTFDTCQRAGFRSVTATTISVNQRAIGVFNLFFQHDNHVGESDRRMLETLGDELGAAINNLRLQSRERELAVSEERNLLARELHDSIAQALAYMNLQLQLCEQSLSVGDTGEVSEGLARIRQGVQESYDDVRELLVHFRSRVGQQDLEAAIDSALRHFSEHGETTTHLDIDGAGAPLDPETETQVLYIVQEALSNVRKHACATRVEVRLHRGADGLMVLVRDDGVGFEVQDGVASQTHIGLSVMHERAQRIGAYFSVHSTLGTGTEVCVEIQQHQNEESAP